MAKSKKKQSKSLRKSDPKKSRRRQVDNRSIFQKAASFFKARRELFQFFGVFIAIIALYYVVVITEVFQEPMQAYVNSTAAVASTIMKIFDPSVISIHYTIASKTYAINIGIGCEGSEPIVIFLSAVVAFPIAFRYKITGLLVGGAVLYLLNIIRIIALFYIAESSYSAFRVYHEEIFPIVLILFAVALFVLWVRRALKKSKTVDDGDAENPKEQAQPA